MKKGDLESLINGIKTPPLDRRQTRLLVDDIVPISESVQYNFQKVAQTKPQKVAQSVAQGSWVAQREVQKVAQTKPQKVAQSVAQNEVEAIKTKIAEMATVEERKEYLKSIGINIKVERRSNSYYFYGIKKIDGNKARFYCGRVM